MSKTSWGFNVKDMDPKIRPQDNFFKHAHGGWMKKTKIPEHESRWGSFTTLSVETQKQLKKIVESLAGKRGAAGSPEQMIRDFYASGLDEKTREKLGAKPLLPWLARVDAIKSKEDLLKLLADLERSGMGGVWGVMIDQDSKNSERYSIHLYQSGLGMPDRDYYLKDDAESKRVREAYVKHVKALHRLLGHSAKEAEQAAEAVLRFETKLAKSHMTKEDARDSEKTYHKLSLAGLQKTAPQVDWKRFLTLIGAPKEREVIAMQPEFLRAVSGMLENMPLTEWKTYLKWEIVNGSAGALSKKFVRQQFEFYGKALSGSKKMKPLWRRALAATNGSLGELLGQLYVKRHFTQEAKRRMDQLVDDLFVTYAERIKKLDWMSPATKKKALIKLRLMNRKIGYPSKWRSYTGLAVRADDYFGNLLRSAEFEHKRQVKKLGKPIDRTEWFMYPQMVNAYCSFSMNEIVFPAAILQAPFFDLSADDAVNYGAIGSVIGHEITHGFDDQGSKFDGKGNMKTWWTKEDRARFDKKAQVLKKQYDRYEVFDGVKVNGQLTLGENIADLGGGAIAFDAYMRHLKRVGRKDIDGYSPEQRFFLGFALMEREIYRPESLKTRVLTDPHSPPEFRVNGPVSNLEEFYDAFGVKPGDTLYRASKERAKIW